MTDTTVIEIAFQTMVVALKLSAPILLTSLVIGFAISLFQSMTQIQEFTLAFVPKLIGVGIALLVSGNWMLHEIDFYDEVEQIWGSRWGAEGIGTLREVLVSRPTENETREEYAREWQYYYSSSAGNADLGRLQAQFDEYYATLEANGVRPNLAPLDVGAQADHLARAYPRALAHGEARHVGVARFAAIGVGIGFILLIVPGPTGGLVVPLRLRLGDQELAMFSTTTVFGFASRMRGISRSWLVPLIDGSDSVVLSTVSRGLSPTITIATSALRAASTALSMISPSL